MTQPERKQNVVVIGAGVGGLATAIHLSKQGYRVTIFEKCDRPGGRCGRLKKDGYTFDTGATIFLMPDVYRQMFASFGETLEDYLDLRRVDPTYRLNFADQSTLYLTSDLPKMKAQMEQFEKGSTGRMLQYLSEGDEHYRRSIKDIVQHDFRSAIDFFSPQNLLRFLRLRTLIPHDRYIQRFFRDPRLQVAFSFHDMYMGLSPQDSPATYSLLQYAELANGLWYPMGGMYGIIEALVSIAEKNGVVLEMNAPVKKIQLDGNRACGVQLEDGRTIAADIVVANPDLGYAYDAFLPESGTTRRVRRMEYGCSVITFYWGLDRQYTDFGVHNLFFSKSFERFFDTLRRGNAVSQDPSFYLHIPTRLDPAQAPAGHDAWVVTVPVGNMQILKDQDWTATKVAMRLQILERLAKSGWQNVDEHIKTEAVVCPPDWRDRYNLPFGSTHGLSHRLTQMGFLRPSHRHARIKNLYFVGASTHPGTGIPMVLTSASFVAKRIQDESRKG
jgi:phytoene desaturase